MLARLAIKILRPALVSTVLSTTLPCACGGRSRHQMPSGTGGSGGFSAAADRGGTGSSSGGSVACLPANRRGCVTGSDCCSEICRFNIGSTWDEDAGAFLPEEIGTCGSCKPSGAACGGDQSSGCCSGFCDHKGRCSCSGVDRACNDDDDCCSGFCYRERSACVEPECDPRLVPDAKPEACWRDLY